MRVIGAVFTDSDELSEQDILSDKLKDEYYREATHYLNLGERVGAESGEAVSGTLAFLTRGKSSFAVLHLLIFVNFQAYNNSQPVQWTMLCDPSTVFWQKNPPMLSLCWARSVLLPLSSQLLQTNLLQARILYARRNYKESLRLFQDVLRYNPACIPDPRIGIGLCFWAMEQKAKAKAAWQRSLEVVCCKNFGLTFLKKFCLL